LHHRQVGGLLALEKSGRFGCRSGDTLFKARFLSP
jgi:hypothetical protein